MSTIITKSPQARKERLNVESMLSFNGVDQYAEAQENLNIKNAVNFDKDWSVSFFLNYQTKSFNQYFFSQYRSAHFGFQMMLGSNLVGNFVRNRFLIGISSGSKFTTSYTSKELVPNRLYYIYAYHNAATQQIHIFINGVKDTFFWLSETDSDIWNTASQFTTRFGWGADRTNDFASNSYLSHLAFFNRTLTESEIRAIHRNGGLLPESTHTNCVAHYPMTQREGQWLYDQVEQYNYAKSFLLPTTIPNPDALDKYNINWVNEITSTVVTGAFSHINGSFRVEITSFLQGGNFVLGFQAPSDIATIVGKNYVIEVVIKTNKNFQIRNRVAVLGFPSTNEIEQRIFATFENYNSTAGRPRIVFNGTSSSHSVGHYLEVKEVSFYEEGKKPISKPYHALLKNYDQAEHTGSAQVAWKDFYTKEQLKVGALKLGFFNSFGVTSQFILRNYNFGTNNIRVVASFAMYDEQNLATSHALLGYTAVGHGKVNLYIVQGSLIFNVSNSVDNSSATRRVSIINYQVIGKPILVDATKIGTDPNNWSIKINGQEVPATQVSGTLGTGDIIFNSTHSSRFGGANSSVTTSKIALFETQIYNGQTLLRHYKFNNLSGNQVHDLTGNENLTLASGDITQFDINRERWVEKSSLLPPIRRGLRFDGVNDSANLNPFQPTKEEGYTIVFAIKNINPNPLANEYIFQASSNFRCFISPTGLVQFDNTTGNGGGGNCRFTRSGIWQDLNFVCFTIQESDIITSPIKRAYLNGRSISASINAGEFVGFDSSTSINIGLGGNSQRWNGLFFKFGIAKGIATPKQIKQLWNNGLLANPKKSWSNLDWQLWLDFNNIIDNNGTYEVANNGSAGGNAVLSGYTANDLQDQVTSKIRVLENTRLNKLYPSFYPKIYPQKS